MTGDKTGPEMAEMGLVHLTFYRFTRLEDLPDWKTRITTLCRELGFQGTVLIAGEGINGGVTGSQESITRFREFLARELGVEASACKENPVPAHAFNRLLVKIKKEIISLGDPDVRPDELTGKRVSACELKRWLDEGRPVVLLDTRNRYEVEVGTFEGATELGLDTFREFAARAPANLEDWKDRTVVTFCTGGIRCEKATALLMKLGLDDVYQLDGGILRYFEENGAAHFKGNCFVFDWRMAVDGALKPAPRSENPSAEFGRHRLKIQSTASESD